jgi:hypothetical protein
VGLYLVTDDFRFEMQSDTGLEDALALVFKVMGPNTKATHFSIEDEVLTLYWSGAKGDTEFPAPCTAELAFPIVKAWLKEQTVDHGPEDQDVMYGKGWVLTANRWSNREICRINATSVEYHK